MTNREFYETIKTMMSDMADFEQYATNPLRDEVFAHAEKEIEKLNDRNARRKSRPSKKSKENEPIKDAIRNILTDTPQTASVIAEKVEISTQKASALCRQLVADNKAKVTDVKVKSKGTQKGYTL